MPRKTKFDERNEAIRKDFDDMTKRKHLRTNHVVQKLANKYFLACGTIEQIVYRIGQYKETDEPDYGDQLDMF
jgi:hypothetical protein